MIYGLPVAPASPGAPAGWNTPPWPAAAGSPAAGPSEGPPPHSVCIHWNIQLLDSSGEQDQSDEESRPNAETVAFSICFKIHSTPIQPQTPNMYSTSLLTKPNTADS